MPPGSLFAGLERARRSLWARLGDLVSGRRPIDAALWQDLEQSLVESDLGVGLTMEVLSSLQRGLPRGCGVDQLREALAAQLEAMLGQAAPLAAPGRPGSPTVYAVLGVNGVGKTTTIGKLAHRLRSQGHQVTLAAGDTFRAAALEQLAIWAQRAGAHVVAHREGADPAAVVYDAIQAAVARGHGAVILDTAGRLHTKRNLMEELRKVVRVAGKALPGAPHETLLVIDATTGANAFEQAGQFAAACGVTGVVLAKLDGTARGGAVFRIRKELGVPVKLVGTGEAIEDLVDFEPRTFVRALLEPVAETGRQGP